MQSYMFAGGMVHLRQDHPLMGAFVEEVVAFPQGEHDDMFDAYLGAAEEVMLKTGRRVFTNKPKGF
jgi:phage terminase large subunit-like protein